MCGRGKEIRNKISHCVLLFRFHCIGPHVCDFSFALILNANGDCGQVLTLAVLAIVLTAPIGSLLIALLGPRLLHKTELGGHNNNNSHLDKQADQAVERMENGKVIHIKPSDSLNNK